MAQDTIASLLRSLARPEAPGFPRLLLDSIKEIEIETEARLYLGKSLALELDQKRINRVAQRIIRGLFFHEKGSLVPKGYEVLAYIQQFGLDRILEVLGVQFPKLRIVQNGIFSYTFKETEMDPNSTVWLTLFYGNLPFVGFTRLPKGVR